MTSRTRLRTRSRFSPRRVLTTIGAVAVAVTLFGPAPAGADSDSGLVHAFGAAPHAGPAPDFEPAGEPIAITADPTGAGYYVAAADGGVFAYGGAAFHGSAATLPLLAPVMDLTVTDGGYWLAAADGGVFEFGAAAFHGSAGGIDLSAPVVGIASTPLGDGYWLAATDGGVFTFGAAEFHGSAVELELDSHVVDIAANPDGEGYWLLTAAGDVLAFGSAEWSDGFAAAGFGDFIGIDALEGGGYYAVRETGMVLASDATHHGYDEPGAVVADVAAHPGGGYLTLARGLAPAIPTVDPNHPFLVCTRGHESDSAGGYQAISSSGTYRGAYQFSRATWDSTARHAARLDLVGVDPAAAAPADQDFLALHLYQWQGASPWLGRCAGL